MKPEYVLKRLHNQKGSSAPAYATTIKIVLDESAPDIGTCVRFWTGTKKDRPGLEIFRELTNDCCKSNLMGTYLNA